MKIPFTKMHGAGNDFIVVDDRNLTFPVDDQAFIERVCARRTGIGSDGIILLQPSETADLRMRFINPDGNEVGMCGNGARCFARRAFDLGAAPEKMAIETKAGMVRAEVLGDQIRLVLTDPTNWRMGLDVGLEQPADFVNTGVEHTVVRVDDLDGLDLQMLGNGIRHHELFAPAGTNANFVRVEADGALSLRTYERGVEAETLACGTGAVAAALVAARQGWVQLPVAVHCAGGYDLTVDSGAGGTTLSGGAATVFEGEVEYGDWI
jgi:diaminopimelate epimerase